MLKTLLAPQQKILPGSGNLDYHLVNTLLWLFVVGSFGMLLFTDVHVQCIYRQEGLQCASCGLTAAFRQALQGRFTGIPFPFMLLFVLVASQIIVRPCVSYILLSRKNSSVAIADAVLHSIIGGFFIYFLYQR
jgi:hypothetical protein